MAKVGSVRLGPHPSSRRLLTELEEEAELDPVEIPEAGYEDLLVSLCEELDPRPRPRDDR